MKTTPLGILAAALLSFSAPLSQGAKISVDVFYDALDPYGEWIETSDYGYVFHPKDVDESWRPYTVGNWAYTDAGWTWVSEEPFGWATYHYGRWANLEREGWVWVPDTDWGPAWVSWRRGDKYVGWAPLPPEARFEVNVGFQGWVDSNYDIGPTSYSFVSVRDLGAPRLREVIVEPRRNITFINETRNITRISYRDNFVVNEGPRYEEFTRLSAQPIRRLRLDRRTDIDNSIISSRSERLSAQISGDSLRVIAPEVEVRRDAAPRRVTQRIQQVQVNRGWRDAGDAQEVQQLRQRLSAQEEKAPANVPRRAALRGSASTTAEPGTTATPRSNTTPDSTTPRTRPAPGFNTADAPGSRRPGAERPGREATTPEPGTPGATPAPGSTAERPEDRSRPGAPGSSRRPGREATTPEPGTPGTTPAPGSTTEKPEDRPRPGAPGSSRHPGREATTPEPGTPHTTPAPGSTTEKPEDSPRPGTPGSSRRPGAERPGHEATPTEPGTSGTKPAPDREPGSPASRTPGSSHRPEATPPGSRREGTAAQPGVTPDAPDRPSASDTPGRRAGQRSGSPDSEKPPGAEGPGRRPGRAATPDTGDTKEPASHRKESGDDAAPGRKAGTPDDPGARRPRGAAAEKPGGNDEEKSERRGAAEHPRAARSEDSGAESAKRNTPSPAARPERSERTAAAKPEGSPAAEKRHEGNSAEHKEVPKSAEKKDKD